MKQTMWIFLISIFAVGTSHAGEFRGVIGHQFGSVEYKDDYSNKLTADAETTGVTAEYYFDESGPFVGASFGKSTYSSYELNGVSLGISDVDADVMDFTIGYRAGELHKPQFFAAASVSRADADGDATNGFGLQAGVERTFEKGRVRTGLSYTSGEDIDTVGLNLQGTVFLSNNVGLQGLAGISIGNGTVLNEDVDAFGWTLGVGIEFRF